MIKSKVYFLYKNRKRKFLMGFRSAFYRYLYGRDIPLVLTLEETVKSLEQKYGLGETSYRPKKWDAEYSSDKWQYLNDLGQLSRYSILTGYMAFLKPGGAFLDIGCGDGILFNKYQPYGFTLYTGVDISEVAISNLRDMRIENTKFVCANGENYQPSEYYDAIIFNESIYYFNQPMKAIEHYRAFLGEGGIIITSIYKNSPRSSAINRRMNKTYNLLDEVYCKNGKKTWVCSVYKPLNDHEIRADTNR